MPEMVKPPTGTALKAFLGSSEAIWSGIALAVGEKFAPLDIEWRPSRNVFGRVCLLRHKKRTLLYLLPEKGKVRVAVVLGERAFHLAMKAALPAAIKKLLSEARPYAEGRGIRFPAGSSKDIPVIIKLVEIKTTPK